MQNNATETPEKSAMTGTNGSKASDKTAAVRFLGGVLLFVGLLGGTLSAKAGTGPDIFDALLFISGIVMIAVGAIKKGRAPSSGARP